MSIEVAAKSIISSKLDENYSIQVYETIIDLEEVWDSLVPVKKFFLRTPYLKVVEKSPPKDIKPLYILFRDAQGEPVGVSYCMLKNFKADESLNYEKAQSKNCFFNAITKYFRNFVAGKIVIDTLVMGNLLLTGEYAYYFKVPLEKDTIFKYLDQSITILQESFKSKGTQLSVHLIKDFYGKVEVKDERLADKFYEFKVEPNMKLDVRDHWLNFDHYLADMKSKYRVRTKKAIKRKEQLVLRDLTVDEIVSYSSQLYDLYLSIAKNVGFNLVDLNQNYLLDLKKAFGDDFRVFIFELDGEILSFFTLFQLEDVLDAHYIGFEKELNKQYDLYLNMLLEMVRFGIDNKFKQIHFSRTASEIKSSIGANPVDMYCYIKHQSTVTNKFMPHIFEYLRPEENWTQRLPFKD